MQYTTQYTVLNLQQGADKFNDISGSARKVTDVDLKNQIELIKEEVKETNDAFEADNIVGVLDGCIDTLFVTLGLLQKLKNLGIDTEGAMKQVAEDNLSKFPSSYQVALESSSEYLHKYIDVSVEQNEEHQVYVLKDQNDKVRKPKGFVGTDLSKYVPAGVELKMS